MRFSIPVPIGVESITRATACTAEPAERMIHGVDEAQFRAFYDDTAAKLRAYLRRAAGDAALADDIFQESFLRLLRTSPGGLDKRQRKAYLYRTATSLLVDHWRSVKRSR